MRLFVAVEIDESLKDRIVSLQTKLIEPGIKLVERDNLHITLAFIGDVPDADLARAREALKNVKINRFEITVGDIGTFPPNSDKINTVWLACKGRLEDLANKVVSALSAEGFALDNRGFSSHLTLARVKQRPRFLSSRISDIGAAELGVQKVSRFVLKRSILTPQGPVYEDVELYDLVP